MKLKEKFSKDSELYKNGFIFDVDTQTIYTTKNKTSVPLKYKDWDIEIVDFSTYSKERLIELGMSDEDNLIELIGGVNLNINERVEQRVFDINQFGDLQILQYGLDRKPHIYNTKDGSDSTNSNREKYHLQTRLHPLHENMCVGKYDFTHAKNTPFWHKSLIELYENKTEIDTLTLTEGQIKAFKGTMDGIPTVGLTSISHFKCKKTGTIHSEIIEIIRVCKIKNFIILWDGDCRDISSKALSENENLTKRPQNFYSFACTIKEMIQEFFPPKKLNVFFATIKSDELKQNPKGLDDLLIEYKDDKKEVLSDYSLIGEMPCKYFEWINITTDLGVKKMRKWFKLDSVKNFHDWHEEQINSQDFLYFGTTYKVEKNEPIKKIDANIKNYKRIGTEFYKLVKEPTPTGRKDDYTTEVVLNQWTKSTITDDHGKDAIKHIECFEGFTNHPSHVNYQSVVANHWNLYYNVSHTPVKGNWSNIELLLKHLFDEQYSLILDYITVLYRFPKEKLPVICLVSKEQKTGKSTFIYLMKLIYKQNMTLISNQDLVGDFNSHWTSKLIVASEETMLEKKEAYEKIKSLTTAKKITRNEKNKSQREIPCMVHFIFCSNHEDDFIKIDDYDSRLWIKKVKTIKQRIPNFDEKLEEEIPAFIEFIENREIEYKKQDRLWFLPKDFRTDAFRNIVENSEPQIIKDLRIKLEDNFINTGQTEIYTDATALKICFNLRENLAYIRKVVKEHLHKGELTPIKRFSVKYITPIGTEETYDKQGRCFVFKREDFVKEDNVKSKKVPVQMTISD